MISTISAMYAGNALRLSIEPPASAVLWRVLRKSADTFSGESDPGAYVAYEGSETSVVDSSNLKNGIAIFYRPYYFDGSAWAAGATATGTPDATYQDSSTDALSLVRDRLEAGLAVEVARGTISASSGYIQVLTAPPIADSQTTFPLVTVHLESEDPQERGIGELIDTDDFNFGSDQWIEKEGWMARVTLELAGWSMNPDERIELRKALRRIVVANLPIFDAAGLTEIVFSQRDSEDYSSYAAPVFMATGTFTCLAPIIISDAVDPIADVVVSAISY